MQRPQANNVVPLLSSHGILCTIVAVLAAACALQQWPVMGLTTFEELLPIVHIQTKLMP